MQGRIRPEDKVKVPLKLNKVDGHRLRCGYCVNFFVSLTHGTCFIAVKN